MPRWPASSPVPPRTTWSRTSCAGSAIAIAACASDTDGIAPCLKRRYEARTTNLEAFADGAYPFIARAVADRRAASSARSPIRIDISYPAVRRARRPISPPSTRASPMPRRRRPTKRRPRPIPGVDRKQGWTYEQGFTLYRPGADAVTVAVEFYSFSGGAHGYGATDCTLVDLRTGKAAGAGRACSPPARRGSRPWSRSSAPISRSSSSRSPASTTRCSPPTSPSCLREPGHYCWRADRLELIFNAYDVGPYVVGPVRGRCPVRPAEAVAAGRRPDPPLSRLFLRALCRAGRRTVGFLRPMARTYSATSFALHKS